MRALSIQQPWAWLIVNGYKDIENRDWPTNVRGEIAVHAGIKFDQYGADWIRSHFPEIPLPAKTNLPSGGIVGTVEIIDCVKTSWSKWFMGTYGFVLANGRPCERIQLRGQLGFFPVPDHALNELRRLRPNEGKR